MIYNNGLRYGDEMKNENGVGELNFFCFLEEVKSVCFWCQFQLKNCVSFVIYMSCGTVISNLISKQK